MSLDPLAPEYPHNSPYAFSENRVIDGIELEGLEWKPNSYSAEIGDDYFKGFSWDPENAFDEDGNLKNGYYKTAMFFYGAYDETLGSDGTMNDIDSKPAIAIVYNEDGKTEIFNAITMSSDPESFPVVQSGLYEGHPQQMATSPYGVSNITWLIRTLDGSAKLPLNDEVNPVKPERNPPYASGVFVHRTNNNGVGTASSQGCQIICGTQYSAFEEFILGVDGDTPFQDRLQTASDNGNVGIIIYRKGNSHEVMKHRWENEDWQLDEN